MFTVNADLGEVGRRLMAGGLAFPACGGVLARWGRPPARSRPSPFSRSSSRSRIACSKPPATSRARNSLSTLKSKPSSSSARPKQYFQSSRPRTASAACRSVRFFANCSTGTIASCAARSQTPPTPRSRQRTPHRHISCPACHGPGSPAPPVLERLRATRAVSAGTCGHGRGCIDMATRFCGRERGKHRRRGRDRDRDHQSIARGRRLYRPLHNGEKIAPVDQPGSCLSHRQRFALISAHGTTASATQSRHRCCRSQATVRAVNGARTSRPALPRSGESPRSGDDQSPAWWQT